MALLLERFNLMCFTFLREAIKSFLSVENPFIALLQLVSERYGIALKKKRDRVT